jgi:short-subunit dehydrogenase
MTTYIMITGATGGLGSAFAIECSKRGFPLYLTDRCEEVADLAQYLTKTYGNEIRSQVCNLTSIQARTDLFTDLQSNGLRFWGLINVAGLDYEGAFLDRSRSQILNIIQLNIEATVDMTYALLNNRDPEKRFMLLNVCSLAAYSPMPYKATYAATKRYLLDFSLALRSEIRSFGTVTALCPAGMPTTPETMRKIFAQGFWGKITTENADFVARKALKAALKGSAICIPGFLNQSLQWLESLVPVSWSIKIIEKRWKAAQEEEVPWRPSYNYS